MNERYIRLNPDTKVPMTKFEDEAYVSKDLEQYPDLGLIIDPPLVVLDFDTEQDAQRMLQLVESEELNTRVVQTSRGYHFYFKSQHQFKSTLSKLAITLRCDFKAWGERPDGSIKKGQVKVKEGGQWRKVLRECPLDELDELPKYLYPVKESKYNFLALEEGAGRNQLLFEYILFLQRAKFTKQEISDTLWMINLYVFETPLGLDEMDTLLRDEAFMDEQVFLEQDWFGDKGQFFHNKFGDYLMSQYNILNYHDETYIYVDGYYQRSDLELEKAMIALFPGVVDRQRQETLKYIRILNRIQEPTTQEHVINVRNGRLDLLTGSLSDHDPQYHDFTQLPVTYDPTARDEEVVKVLKKMFSHDDDLILLFKEILGYTLTKNLKYQQAFFLVGGGSNGKSTLLRMVQELLGHEQYTALSLTDFENPFQLAELNNKLANIGDDISNLTLKNTGVFKKLVSGEPMIVSRKYGQPFKLSSHATIWFSANKLPSFADRSDGMERRMTILPFNAKFLPQDKDYDPNILDKVTSPSALSTLLNLAIEGLAQLEKDQRFLTPKAVVQAKKDYQAESSTIVGWATDAEEHETKEHLLGKSTQQAYREYKVWAENNGIKKVFSKRVFTLEICKHFDYQVRQKRTMGEREYIFDLVGNE